MQGSARIDELRQKFHENPRRYFAPLANEYRKAGDPEQAIAICRAHLAQQPAHMSGHVVYAQALYDAGRIDESRVVFEKALSLDPDNAIVLRHLGDISRQKGDTAEARHWYTRALDADPHDREIAAYIAELTEPLTETSVTEAAPETVATLPSPAAAPEEPATSAVEESVTLPEAEAQGPEAEASAPEAEAAAAPEPEAAGAPESVAPTPPEPEAPSAPAEEVSAVPAEEVSAVPAEEVSAVPAEEVPAAPAEEVRAPEDLEVEIPKAEEPPHLTDIPNYEMEEALFAANEDIELFPDLSSPFVTRTMADLYARQGYKDQALEVYRKLAADNPNDTEIANRIRELSSADSSAVADAEKPVEPTQESPAESTPTAADSTESASAVSEFAEPTDESAEFGFIPLDETSGTGDQSSTETLDGESSDKPVHFTDMELQGDQWDADSWAAGFSSEETEVVPFDFVAPTETIDLSDDEATPIDVPDESETAATPLEAPSTDRADSSLIAETDRTGEFATPEPPLGIFNDAREEIQTEDYYRPFDESQGAEPPEASIALPERAVEEISAVEERAEVSEQPAASAEIAPEAEEAWRPEDETLTQPEELVSATPEAVSSAEAGDTSPYATEEDTSPYAPEEEAPSEPEPEHFVAYSPQPPDDEDLPHYTPVGPTIREFFATLGAYSPPANGSGASITARAAVPDIDAEPPSYETYDTASEETSTADQVEDQQQPADEFPLVSDAFANLFPDSPVTEEDTRAAFALSGAMSSQPVQPPARSYDTPPAPVPAVEAPAATQESEEDIRRFREWLDGLAET